MPDHIEPNPELQHLDAADYYRARLRDAFNASRSLHGLLALSGGSVKVPRALKRELKSQRKRAHPKHPTRFLERILAALIQLRRACGELRITRS